MKNNHKNKKDNKFYFVGAEELDSFLDSSKEEIQVVEDRDDENTSNTEEEKDYTNIRDDIQTVNLPDLKETEVSEETKDEDSETDIEEEKEQEEIEVSETEEDENSDTATEEIDEEKGIEEIPSTSIKDDFVTDEDISNHKSSTSASPNFHKPYFSFETRLAIMVIGVLILLAGTGFFIVKAVKYGRNETVTYDEISKANYNVCLNENNLYQQSCLDEGMQYLSTLVHNISTNFEYDVKFSTNIDYDLGYHVVGLTRIYDKNDSSKVLYKTEDVLVEKVNLKDDTDTIHFETQANVDYNHYNNIVNDYKNRYALDATATLEIILYLDEPTESRNVASITVPLGVPSFSIGKYNLSNVNRSVEVETNHWNEHTAFYGITATVLFLLAMILIYRMTRLVWKVTNNRNRFQTTLTHILREYDRIIVIARDGYESNIQKRIIKVSSFDELLDAREALEKPIIYSKVNSVKSEFIVEDDEKLYKYVIKESDF